MHLCSQWSSELCHYRTQQLPCTGTAVPVRTEYFVVQPSVVRSPALRISSNITKGPTLPEATRGSSTLTLLASPGKRPPRWTSALGTRYTPNPHFRHIPSRLCPGRRDRVARRSTAPRSPRNMLRDCHRCLHRNGDVTHRRRAGVSVPCTHISPVFRRTS